MDVYQHEFGEEYSLSNSGLRRRYDKTMAFLEKHSDNQQRILDLGIPNILGGLMTEAGHIVSNTEYGQDLDLDYAIVQEPEYDMVTAFEIFEHMVAPFNLLREIRAPKLVASVPLDLWFAKAYWNEKDEWDRHYHEFEPRQFDMLLKKAGWKIVASEKWTSVISGIGFRPILRRFTPRYYIVYCERV